MNIYMGWDPNEQLAYDVAKWSIYSRSNRVVEINPLKLNLLNHLLTRPIEFKNGKMWCPISEAPMATEFAISRFCVPHLQKNGWALFCDCDIVCQCDINEIMTLTDEKYAVMVVKHNHQPTEQTKMGGLTQTSYSRKNWSSVVLWNCEHPSHEKLTVEILNTWPGRDLHAFKWLADDDIGELPAEWNYLVGVNKSDTIPKILHYTLGGPWIRGWTGGELDEIWRKEHDQMVDEVSSTDALFWGIP